MTQIMIARTAGKSAALGNIWRITAKKTDFYLDPLGEAGTIVHLSVHGPTDRFDGHRFHIRVDREMATAATGQAYFMQHSVPRRGCLRWSAGRRPRVPCRPHPLDMAP